MFFDDVREERKYACKLLDELGQGPQRQKEVIKEPELLKTTNGRN